MLTDYTIGPPSLSRCNFLGNMLAALFHRLANAVSVHHIVAREHCLCLPAANLHDDVFRYPGIAHVDGRADPQIMDASAFVRSALGVTYADASRVRSLVPLISVVGRIEHAVAILAEHLLE